MKKLLLSFTIILMTFAFITPEVHAKSKRNVRKSQRVKKSKKAQFNKIAYESVWFSQLSQKDQMKYLKTMANLVMKLSRRGFSMDDSFMNYLIPYADAADRINNGFIFDGANDDKDYDDFLESLGILGGPLDPGCTAPNQLCAPYLGMVCSGGTAKLACSPDSTPTCASRGSLECLRNTLEECGMNASGAPLAGKTISAGFCTALDSTMRRGLQKVRSHCTSGGRADTNYCRQAVARLDGVDDPPSEGETPTGADCEKMIREMAKTRDGRTEGDDSTANRNNDFWRNMTGFAQQACGHRSVTRAMGVFGTCSRSDLGDGAGNITRVSVKSYRRSKDVAGFERCISESIKAIEKQRDARIQAFKDNAALPEAKRDSVLSGTTKRSIRATFQRQIDAKRTTASRTGECSRSEENRITDGAGKAVNNELNLENLMGLANKLRKRQDLTSAEQNLFRAGTGLTVQQFRNSFCAAGTHDAFKKQLRRSLSGSIRVNETVPYASASLGEARVARTKMGRCLASLSAVNGEDGSGCRLYKVEQANMLKCASETHPILAVNRKTNRCVLVTGHSRRATGSTDVKTLKGVERRKSDWKMTLNVRTPSGTSELDNYRSESFFQKDHQLQEYRCDGDRSFGSARGGLCWMRPRAEDPAHAGEAEARETLKEM